MEKLVEYKGMVYRDTAVDLLYDLVKEKIIVLNRQIKECSNEIKKLAIEEKELLKQVKEKAGEVTKCSVYGAPDTSGSFETWVVQKLEPHQKELNKHITKLTVLCAERYELQHMLGRCSMLCAVEDDDDGYDYGEDE